MNNKWKWLLPVLSGFFIGTSYIPFPPWASLFCFIPLWHFWLKHRSGKQVILAGWLASFVFTLIGFNWVAHTLHEFAHLPWWAATLGLLLFAAIAHLFVPLAGIIWYLGQRKFNWPETLSLPIMALLTALCENYSLTLFDWNFGYTWYATGLPIFQWAEYIGFSGLSSLTILYNLALYMAWKNRNRISGKRGMAIILLSFLLLNSGGLWIKRQLPRPDAQLSALLVQANIGNLENLAVRLGRGHIEETLARYATLTETALATNQDKAIDFILWPEVAFPSLLGVAPINSRQAASLSNFVHKQQTPLITGAFGFDLDSRLPSNSLFVLDKDGQLLPPHYNKSILLAFGEYIPGEDLFPHIRAWLPQTGQFARGSGPVTLLKLNGYIIGPQICYESLFPDFSRSLADLGAQFIVNVTNDSWYGTWQEPYQHMYMTLARAIEVRRPVLRSTNTGISTVVLASGEILEQSPLHEEWAGIYGIPYRQTPERTFYQQWHWITPVFLWITLAVFLALGLRHKRI